MKLEKKMRAFLDSGGLNFKLRFKLVNSGQQVASRRVGSSPFAGLHAAGLRWQQQNIILYLLHFFSRNLSLRHHAACYPRHHLGEYRICLSRSLVADVQAMPPRTGAPSFMLPGHRLRETCCLSLCYLRVSGFSCSWNYFCC